MNKRIETIKEFVNMINRYSNLNEKERLHLIIFNYDLNEDLLEYIISNYDINNFHWISISGDQKLSEEFIRKYKDKIHYPALLRNELIPEQVIDNIKDIIDWDKVLWYHTMNIQNNYRPKQKLVYYLNKYGYLNSKSEKAELFIVITNINEKGSTLYSVFSSEEKAIKIKDKLLLDYTDIDINIVPITTPLDSMEIYGVIYDLSDNNEDKN